MNLNLPCSYLYFYASSFPPLVFTFQIFRLRRVVLTEKQDNSNKIKKRTIVDYTGEREERVCAQSMCAHK